MILALLLAAVAPPSAEARALGVRLARTQTLATVLPMLVAKESSELVAAHPELTPAQQARLRATARRVGEAGLARMTAAFGRHYAARLPLADLRALVAFHESPVAVRYRAVVPAVTAAAMTELGKLDFKGDVTRAFCAKTGKLCDE